MYKLMWRHRSRKEKYPLITAEKIKAEAGEILIHARNIWKLMTDTLLIREV